jgi:hypothetical protein
MRCPKKITTYNQPNGEYSYTNFDECDQELCAWWNAQKDGTGSCAVLTIAQRLDDMLVSGLPVRQ